MNREKKIKKLILLQKEACAKKQKIREELNKSISELDNYYEKLCKEYNVSRSSYYIYIEYKQIPSWIYEKANLEEIKKLMGMEYKKRTLITLRDNMTTKIDKLYKKLDKFGY